MKVSLTYLRGLELKQLDVEDLQELCGQNKMKTSFHIDYFWMWLRKPMKLLYQVQSVKEVIKKIVPSYIKVNVHLLKRTVLDITKGYYFNFAKRKYTTNDFSNSLELKQELKPNEAKNKNLLRAIRSIEQIQINPNEILSFWRIVGNPSKKNGFTESRSLVNGKIENTIGGGLCQLSGLMYYISLIAQLEILERHNHSIDIYNEETRFTPLGSDATVAYGYKDLKIRNNFSRPIKFNFSIKDDTIKVMIMHSSVIRHNVVQFKEVISDGNTIEVITIINNKVYNNSIYKAVECWGLANLLNMKRIRPSFSLTFSSFFGLLSAFAGFIFSGQEDTNFEYLYIYTGLGGLIGGYLVSNWLIMKPNNYNFSRLIISGFTIGFVSPYTCWTIAFCFDSLVNKETRLTFIENPIMMLLSPASMTLINLVFFGWLIIPLAILTLFLTKKILQSKRPS